MANVAEHIDQDGILRALLSKIVNNEPVAIYPHTSAEIVNYKDTTVKMSLDSLNELSVNLSNLMKNTIKNVNALDSDTYKKEYITNALSEMTNNLSNTSRSLQELTSVVNSIDVYNKTEVDQKITSISELLTISLAQMTRDISNLNTFISANYDTSTDVTFKIDSIKEQIGNMNTVYNNYINSLFYQYKIDIASNIENILNEFYKKDHIDSKLQELDKRFSQIDIALSNARGDNETMNIQSVSDVNTHTDSVKNDIIDVQSNKISSLEENIKSGLERNTDSINQNITNLAGTLAGINSSLVSRIDNVLVNLSSQISSLGGQGGTIIQYDSADEEAY